MTADSTNVQSLTDALMTICGREFVRVEGEMTSVSPASTEEVAAVLRAANSYGMAVTAWGSGSKQGWGGARKAALILHTDRLTAVREHTWQDMTCIVEAGCSWSKLQEALLQHGQFVALDPLWSDRATIGGIVATNDSGSLRHRYGSLRDLVIGMTIVLADGTVAKTGGKVVKNVAGYDLHKLMTGAMGTLGVITDVAFRLHSIPRHTCSVVVRSLDVGLLGTLLLQILDSHLSTERLQVRGGGDGFFLDLGLVAMPDVLLDQTNAVTAMAEKLGLVASEASSAEWDARQALFDRADGVLAKATMMPSDIAHFSAAVRELGGDCVTQAVGVMTLSVPVSATDQVVHLRQQLEAKRGSLTILRQPDEAVIEPWGTLPDTMPLMRAIKQRFDPQHILNPGRYLGGI
ncbi:FAD-binding oxidoreductase [Granulicella sp. WH15]|uniref:FAD-binding oxidoreductase n=1 Tax=Granulicella sp. WH15 TaxID=2602070 RepID=UPI0013672D00|nr:FAD-binding oxidoreductase [Granulicella sp. WH15]QHN03275.1 FAD-binding oxidoreductase [Granulicella sp. WH15]